MESHLEARSAALANNDCKHRSQRLTEILQLCRACCRGVQGAPTASQGRAKGKQGERQCQPKEIECIMVCRLPNYFRSPHSQVGLGLTTKGRALYPQTSNSVRNDYLFLFVLFVLTNDHLADVKVDLHSFPPGCGTMCSTWLRT